MGFGMNLGDMRKSHIFAMFNLKRNFSRAHPLVWVFIFAVLWVLIMLSFESLKVLAWLGLMIVIIFLACWGTWIYQKLK
jgi:hypothetical protein